MNNFVWFRYVVFALSIIWSAVIASFSVWNLGYALSPNSLGQVVRVDSYGIAVNGVVLLGVFTMIFIEVGRKNAFTSRIWFDCLWSGLFFLLNLSFASVVTALLPSQMCSGTPQLPSGACTSTKALQGSTWVNTITLFAYFATIFLTAVIYSGSDNRLWGYSIYNLSTYNRSNGSSRLPSPPSSPIPGMLHRFIKPPSIIAPRPQRPANSVADLMPYAYRSGLSPDYQIEHFQLPDESQRPPPVIGSGPSNLYPGFMRPSLPLGAYLPSPSKRYSDLPSVLQQKQQGPGGSPPPLGEWPRLDIMKQESRRSRRITPKVPLVHPEPPPPPSVPQPDEATTSGNVPMPLPRSKPSGPRTRGSISQPGNRPPPLDLTDINALNPNR